MTSIELSLGKNTKLKHFIAQILKEKEKQFDLTSSSQTKKTKNNQPNKTNTNWKDKRVRSKTTNQNNNQTDSRGHKTIVVCKYSTTEKLQTIKSKTFYLWHGT